MSLRRPGQTYAGEINKGLTRSNDNLSRNFQIKNELEKKARSMKITVIRNKLSFYHDSGEKIVVVLDISEKDFKEKCISLLRNNVIFFEDSETRERVNIVYKNEVLTVEKGARMISQYCCSDLLKNSLTGYIDPNDFR